MEILIGSSEQCHLRYPDERVSRKHCRLLLQEGRLFICDLGSTNGTWIKRQKIAGTSWIPIAFGDPVHLAGMIPLDWNLVEQLMPGISGRTRRVDSVQVEAYMARQAPPPPSAPPPPPQEEPATVRSHPSAPSHSVPPPSQAQQPMMAPPPSQAQQPIIVQQSAGTNRSDLLYAAHAAKSYVGSAFLTWILYYIGFYIIGLIMNIVYLGQAAETERVTGSSPSGRGCLQFLFFVHVILPVILILLIVGGVIHVGSVFRNIF